MKQLFVIFWRKTDTETKIKAKFFLVGITTISSKDSLRLEYEFVKEKTTSHYQFRKSCQRATTKLANRIYGG